jgi:putative ATP-dependent endonuclease of OLD family
LEDANARVQEVYEEQVSSVNDAWQRHKLDLVPGDHLLDMVCKKYKVRFKKELDGSRLAALMSEFEIDEEIKEIISEIGN